MEPKLLTRDEFRESVFKRDGYLCVLCKKEGKQAPAVDAHHLIERRLWGSSQGYFIDNGISVCEPCHLLCEQTKISVEEAREAASIKTVLLPEHLEENQIYDKWGNPVLENGTRLRGELFNDESVQKILSVGGVLNLFTNRVKYPRTYHFDFSPGLTNDDRVMTDTQRLYSSKDVVMSEKRDGEGTTLMRDYLHARSLEYHAHPSRNWIKALHAKIAHDIPEDWRICGENLFATHSLHYENLDTYFEVFSVWNEKNICLSWDETVEWANLLGLKTVPVLYRGPFDKNKIRSLYPEPYSETIEGYVVRIAESFHYKEFRRCVAKFVRKGHVTTTHHWRSQPVVPNKLKDK